MNMDKNAPRLLGAAFLWVIVTSLTQGLLFQAAVGSGGIAEGLVNISNHETQMRLSVLFELLNGSSVIFLAALLYIVLHEQNRIMALVALGWWLGEALILGLTAVGTLALIPLSQYFVEAGLPENSFYLTLGEFLHHDVYQQGHIIHMWFYCIGGILWYFLLYRSNFIPRAISFFGLIAVSLGILGIALELLGYAIPIFVYLPILPFELTIGFWLLLKGINNNSVERAAPQ